MIAKNDIYKRHQGHEQRHQATVRGLEERHTKSNSAHHEKRKFGNSNGILKGGDFMTINEQANKEILKAKKALVKAIDLLMEDGGAYWNNRDIFHNTTVNAVNRLITASQIITEVQDN